MSAFDEQWIEVFRDRHGIIKRVEACDATGQRVPLLITKFEVEQTASGPGVAKLSVLHGHVVYKDAPLNDKRPCNAGPFGSKEVAVRKRTRRSSGGRTRTCILLGMSQVSFLFARHSAL
jgi:hypothetical protein